MAIAAHQYNYKIKTQAKRHNKPFCKRDSRVTDWLLSSYLLLSFPWFKNYHIISLLGAGKHILLPQSTVKPLEKKKPCHFLFKSHEPTKHKSSSLIKYSIVLSMNEMSVVDGIKIFLQLILPKSQMFRNFIFTETKLKSWVFMPQTFVRRERAICWMKSSLHSNMDQT